MEFRCTHSPVGAGESKCQAFWNLPEGKSLRLSVSFNLHAENMPDQANHTLTVTTFKTKARPEPWGCLMRRAETIKAGPAPMEL